MDAPTQTAYAELLRATDFFNRRLFGGQLPDCMLTLQRKNARVYGFFSPGRFIGSDGTQADELAMNPMHFAKTSTLDVLSTLAHEQVHVWQQHFGKPGRGKYHNKEWGKKMKDIGLHPSSTGEPGGEETGDQMTHYILDAGAFDKVARELMRGGFRFSWAEDSGEGRGEGDPAIVVKLEPEKDKSNRTKFTCPSCADPAWGKPSLKLICGRCHVDMVANHRGAKKQGGGICPALRGKRPNPLLSSRAGVARLRALRV